ncbi:MAG: serine hydrolase [Bacteroidetes bacterium HGW-Bacteroidetes-15]|nr:MAG: serine hydrolase [Bacteroidetes bacterium HGW-Bacteroidetes-15]
MKPLKPFLKLYLFVAFLMLLSVGCKTPPTNQNNKFNSQFQSVIDGEISENIPGILVNITSPKLGVEWSGASGLADWEQKVAIGPDQTFRIASVTKTFVAATVLRLWEDNKLSLDDFISKYISLEHAKILEEGGYSPNKITIRHLLSHTSGLGDHTNSGKYTVDFLKDRHIWSRTETLIDLVTLMEPAGELGAQFSYSDTGYVLLGEIIEKITGKSMGDAMLEQLQLKKLGLKDTYMEEFDGDFTGKRIHQYHEGFDTYNFHPSLDYFGGGGLLSTSHDLSRFFISLFNHEVYRNQSTLDTMLTSVLNGAEQTMDYRFGIWRIEINGKEAYTHTGFWGTQVVYIPEIETAISANYSQRWTDSRIAPVIPKILEVIEKED